MGLGLLGVAYVQLKLHLDLSATCCAEELRRCICHKILPVHKDISLDLVANDETPALLWAVGLDVP